MRVHTQRRRNAICTRAHRNTLPYTLAHIAYTRCYKVQQTHAHACALLTLLVPLEATPHSLCYSAITSVKHATRRIILTFSFQGNDEYAGAYRRKTRGRQSLALLDTVYSQEREQLYFNIKSGLLVSTQSA